METITPREIHVIVPTSVMPSMSFDVIDIVSECKDFCDA